MTIAAFASQTWTLTKKDLLLIARRRWFSTFVRAVAFPIVLSVIIASVKHWIHNHGGYGIGTPSAIRSLPEAFNVAGSNRGNFVIVDRGLQGDDVRAVIQALSTLARNGGREVHTVPDSNELPNICPSSSKGVTNCFAAVDFWSSPNTDPASLWNYTIWQDSVIQGANVLHDDNAVQIYTLPLQRAIDSLIAARNNGSLLPDEILQYPYTIKTQAEVDFEDSEFFGLLITQALAFALFLALCGIAYHLTGYVVRQREEGMLQLIDAQMPNKSRWECLAARMLSTHLAFDIIYMPAWIISGAVVGSIVFTHSNAGYFVLAYMLCGLAMTSFSILASSLFRRQQLSALSAIVAALAFAIVAQFSQSGQTSTSTTAAIATGLLFPPCSFVYFLVSGAVAEIFSQPLVLDQGLPPLLVDALGVRVWKLTPATFLGFFAFQIAVYPVLAMVVERFLWGNSFRGRHFRSTQEMDGNALRISNFTKRYSKAVKKSDRILAVDQLSLDFFAGSITMLLGANGCGKSTTLKTITGLESITEGRIEIDNSGGIGLCPQNNTHFGEMTVQENVWFFQQLKNPSLSCRQGLEEVNRLIAGCDLQRKVNARAKSLSGGQMRKLQLCMMLAGGSKVCCIDEASSGIDPLARRKIWEILLAERGHRTMLLTTHFLDESEVLADHIALMSKGKLRAQGTVATLKSSLGGGFRIVLPGRDSSTMQSFVSGDATSRQHVNDTIFDVPSSESLSPLLTKLDQGGITDYQIEGPSIETIFLQLADEVRADQEKPSTDEANVGHHSILPRTMGLHTGKGCGPVEQTWVLFRKRMTILKHNFMPYVASLFIPLVVAGLVTRFFQNVESNGLQCQNPNDVFVYNPSPQSLTAEYLADTLIIGPPSEVTGDRLQKLIPNSVFCEQDERYCYEPDPADWNSTVEVTTLGDFNTQIADSISGDGFFQGGFFIGNFSPPVFAWLASGYGATAPVFVLGTLNMALTNTSVAVSYQNFVAGYSPQDFVQSLVAVFTTLGFILFPGLFALYPTRERLQKVRAMQYSNGITTGPLWIAYSLFDFTFLLLISVLSIVIFLVNGYAWYGLGYLFVVFLFYGIASTAYSYVISLFAPSQLAAIAMTCILQVVIAMLFFVGCFLTVDQADLSAIPGQLEIIYYTVGLICPAVSLLRALLVGLNVYGISCNGEGLAFYPGDIKLYGGPILYLVLQTFILVAFLIYWESGRSLEAFGIRFRSRSRPKSPKDVEKDSDAGSDTIEDLNRLSEGNEGLRVGHISKTFGRNRAVDNVSFGVLPSEKFALLGPNGGGKSTTISLIRGDLRPDHSAHRSEIHIAGDSLMQTPVAAKQHLGVCPQFDSVDTMTLSENLHFYARARGVKGKEKDENVREIVTRLGLTEHTNKLVGKLSGGTKRKLSLGIALIANPSVLLLDEPSSGMDVAAKRALWRTLQAISTGRCLLITTHSMEEADALCDRAGIMASQMLALGTIPELHARYSDKIYMQIVHDDAPRSSSEDIDALWTRVRSTFLIAETERSVGGQLRFAIPTKRDTTASAHLLDGSNMGMLYQAIESSKAQMRIRDYSIGHATLDQVFLNVVSRHEVDEENSQHLERRSMVQRLLRK